MKVGTMALFKRRVEEQLEFPPDLRPELQWLYDASGPETQKYLRMPHRGPALRYLNDRLPSSEHIRDVMTAHVAHGGPYGGHGYAVLTVERLVFVFSDGPGGQPTATAVPISEAGSWAFGGRDPKGSISAVLEYGVDRRKLILSLPGDRGEATRFATAVQEALNNSGRYGF